MLSYFVHKDLRRSCKVCSLSCSNALNRSRLPFFLSLHRRVDTLSLPYISSPLSLACQGPLLAGRGQLVIELSPTINADDNNPWEEWRRLIGHQESMGGWLASAGERVSSEKKLVCEYLWRWLNAFDRCVTPSIAVGLVQRRPSLVSLSVCEKLSPTIKFFNYGQRG